MIAARVATDQLSRALLVLVAGYARPAATPVDSSLLVERRRRRCRVAVMLCRGSRY